MKITKSELIELDVCEEGLERFIMQTGNTDEPVEVASLVGGENTYGDLLWLASKKIPKERIVRFACDCALLNVELIEPYTNRYESIVEFLRNPIRGGTVSVAHNDYATASAYDAARAAHAAYATRAAHAAYAVYAAHGTVAARAVYAAHGTVAARAARAAGGEERVNKLLKELLA